MPTAAIATQNKVGQISLFSQNPRYIHGPQTGNLRLASITISGLDHLRNSFQRGYCFLCGARLQMLPNCRHFPAS